VTDRLAKQKPDLFVLMVGNGKRWKYPRALRASLTVPSCPRPTFREIMRLANTSTRDRKVSNAVCPS
jgi:hypothetical protein